MAQLGVGGEQGLVQVAGQTSAGQADYLGVFSLDSSVKSWIRSSNFCAAWARCAGVAMARTATVSSAELLGLADRSGRIAPGFEADLILLPGNPLEDVMALQDVLMVISNGQVALKRIPFGLD